MLLVRQVAPPMAPCFALWSCFPMELVRQDARRDGAGSAGCSPRRCLALRCEAASRWCFAPSLAVAASRCCIAAGCASRCCGSAGCSPEGALLCAVKLLPDGALRRPCRQLLPDGAGGASLAAVASRCYHIVFRGAATSSAQTSASLHPPAALRLRAPPIHGGTWASTVCAEDEFPTPLEASFAILQLRPARLQPHPAQVHQIASQTEVLPRRMRFVAGRGHCSSKSPRARILVLGTSGAHWPARWPRFELTERVAKSQLSGY